MKRYYYDFHIHSCLSPCADNDSTPANIAGMAVVCGLDVVALTDHNTCKNCPSFFKACEAYGIVPIAGMELTTAEDIHVVCLFDSLADAMRFDAFVDSRRMKIKNRTDIFGEQLIIDENDNVAGYDEYLLPNATDIPLEEAPETVKRFNGICFPAHIDRDANGIVAILGTVPQTPHFDIYEIRDPEVRQEYCQRFGIAPERTVISSDAHYLADIRDKESYFELPAELSSADEIRTEIFKRLRCL